MYKEFKNYDGVVSSVIRLEDYVCIPCDPANSDYTAYLKWLEEGNVLTPADEPTQGA